MWKEGQITKTCQQLQKTQNIDNPKTIYLEGGLGVKDAVVGHDADLHAVNLREAGHDGGCVQRLELVEATAVSDTSNNLQRIIVDRLYKGRVEKSYMETLSKEPY